MESSWKFSGERLLETAVQVICQSFWRERTIVVFRRLTSIPQDQMQGGDFERLNHEKCILMC